MTEDGVVLHDAATARPTARRNWLGEADPGAAAMVHRLLEAATIALPGMQGADGVACHTRRFSATGLIAPPEGWSLRNTAISALGVRHLDADGQRGLLGGRTAAEVCTVLIDRISSIDYLGDAGLAVWATAECAPELLDRPLAWLDALDVDSGPRRVEALAWMLCGLIATRSHRDVEQRLDRTRARLLSSSVGHRQLFGHATGPGVTTRPAHVGSFADQAYAIQALARLHASGGDPDALAAANRCAQRICMLQGPAGQWWSRYDARTGQVVEDYPVHTVNQYALGPMALLDLAEAGGWSDPAAIVRGLTWLAGPPEVDRSLVLDRHGLIVRRVARRSAPTLVRRLATDARPGVRLAIVDQLWPPAAIDRQCRPDELASLLDCWLGGAGSSRPAAARGAHLARRPADA